tara:strand:- start:6338 stop:7681 length:1344 start_codon:yes stop_codon:yes gene_type:complete
MTINKRLMTAKLINILFLCSYYLDIKIFITIFFKSYIVRGANSKLILYLSPERSTFEVDYLNKKKFALLKLPKLITNEIIIFCIDKKKNLDLSKNPKKNLKKINFFSKIFEDLNLRLIISPAYHYTYDNIFGKFFSSKKMKYLIFHREGYNFSKNHLDSLKKFIKKNQYKADKILVHNKIYKDLFKSSLTNSKNNIEIQGPLRMQQLVKFHKNNNKMQKPIKILFLSFTPAYAGGNPLKLGKLGQYGKLNIANIKFLSQNKFLSKSDRYYDYEQFYFAHKIFLECVLENPDYNFEIRLKFNNGYNRKIITNLCKEICGNFPSNLKLDEQNLWKSINQSYFVCGYGSTGMLEASILNKPAIQIINKNLIDSTQKLNNLRISNHLSSFKLANSKKEFKVIFKQLVLNKKRPKEFVLLIKKAKLAFNNYIFNIKKNNNKKFKDTIADLIK